MTHSATKQPLAREQVRELLREATGTAQDARELRDGEFTVCYATDELVLKVWPAAGTPLLAYEQGLVHGEVELCRRAREVGFPAPELVHVDTSHRLVARDWLVMTRLRGRPLAAAGGAGPELERDLGRALARLHRVEGETFGYVARPLRGETWADAFARSVDAVLADAAHYRVALPCTADDVRHALAASVPALAEVTRPSLVHFDVWSGNVLVHAGRLVGVIDGERSLYADPLAEWAMSSMFAEPEERPDLLTAYAEEAGEPLRLDEAARVRLDLYRLYLYLIVLVEEAPRRYDPRERAPVRTRVERALQETLTRL